MPEDVRIVHVVPGLDGATSGIATAARLIAAAQNARLVDARETDESSLSEADEVWVHSTWTPAVWRASALTTRLGKRLVRMPHGNLDPLRRQFSALKKMIAGPFERRSLRMASRIVVTCNAEKSWVEDYLGARRPTVEVLDMRPFFPSVNGLHSTSHGDAHELRILYMGRKHPLKGVQYLETAVAKLRDDGMPVDLRVETNARGDEKESAFAWCDVFCLPTLSENFGIVVAEALARGKPVVTTDGAPAWADEPRTGADGKTRLVYLKGYRDAVPDIRVRMLKDALRRLRPEPEG